MSSRTSGASLAVALALALGVPAVAGCGPKRLPVEDWLRVAEVRGGGAKEVARLRALAADLRDPPEAKVARRALARAIMDYWFGWKVSGRRDVLLDLQALLGDTSPADAPDLPAKLSARARTTIGAWLTPTDDIAQLARTLEGERLTAGAAGEVLANAKHPDVEVATRLLLLSGALQALGLGAGTADRGTARVAADAGAAFPFPCPVTFVGMGRFPEEAGREAALREGCAALCAMDDCWGRVAPAEDRVYASAEARLLAEALVWAGRASAGPTERSPIERLIEPELKAVAARLRAGVATPLEFLLREGGEAEARWPVALPGATLSAAAAFVVKGTRGWLVGTRPVMKPGTTPPIVFDNGKTARLTTAVPEDRIGEALKVAREGAPAAVAGMDAGRVAIALPATALSESLTAALAAAGAAGYAEADLLGRVVGGGIGVVVRTALAAAPPSPGDLVVTEAAVAIRVGAEMKVVDEGAPLATAWEDRPTGTLGVRFDARASVGRVLDIAEELAASGYTVWVGPASASDVVDARNAAVEKAMVFAGAYSGAKLEIVRARIEKAIRACMLPAYGKGKVTVRLVISGTGVVMDAHVPETTFVEDKLVECWGTRLRKVAFPAPSPAGLAEVEHSLTL